MKSSYTSTDEVAKLREIQVEDCSPRFDYFLRVLTFAVTQAIKKLSPHPSIVKLHEVLFDPPSGRLALVFESVRFIRTAACLSTRTQFSCFLSLTKG